MYIIDENAELPEQLPEPYSQLAGRTPSQQLVH
jgi:hypothetical protein